MATIETLGHAQAMGARLLADVQEAQRLSIAVAFAKESALASVDLEQWARPTRDLRFVAGTDFTLTDLGLLRKIEVLPGASCRIFPTLPGTTFHPKLYVIDKADRRVAYVGSSNFTRGGLYANVEANVRIEGHPSEPELRQPADLFDQLFLNEVTLELSPDFEAAYNEAQDDRRAMLARYPNISAQSRLIAAEGLFIARNRARVSKQHLLVGTPRNYDLCMKSRTFGARSKVGRYGIERFASGDVFLFHVSDGRGIRAMGMFTGPAYYDDADVWKHMERDPIRGAAELSCSASCGPRSPPATSSSPCVRTRPRTGTKDMSSGPIPLAILRISRRFVRRSSKRYARKRGCLPSAWQTPSWPIRDGRRHERSDNK